MQEGGAKQMPQISSKGSVNWLAWMDADEGVRDRLVKASVGRRYAAGETIYWEGDDVRGIHIVESGVVGLRKFDSEGHAVMLHLLYECQPFGHDTVLAGRTSHGVSAECISPALVHFIPASDFFAALKNNPQLGFHLLRQTARDLTQADARMFEAMVAPAHIRLTNLLCSFRKRFATTGKDGAVVLHLPFSKRSIGEMIGARPETISRMIRKLEMEGIADFEPDGIHLHARETFGSDWDGAIAA
jgi:CRP/FNR family transcriptional regulator